MKRQHVYWVVDEETGEPILAGQRKLYSTIKTERSIEKCKDERGNPYELWHTFRICRKTRNEQLKLF